LSGPAGSVVRVVPGQHRLSMSRTAGYATVIGDNCEVLLQPIAERAARGGLGGLGGRRGGGGRAGQGLRGCGLLAGGIRSRPMPMGGWRRRPWRRRTWRCGRGGLAYADPGWLPSLGPSGAVREPGELTPEPDNIGSSRGGASCQRDVDGDRRRGLQAGSGGGHGEAASGADQQSFRQVRHPSGIHTGAFHAGRGSARAYREA